MADHLPAWGQVSDAAVRVQVSDQQHDLKEQHTGRPYAGAAAEPWKNVLANEWLNLKQEKRPEKRRQGKEGVDQGA